MTDQTAEETKDASNQEVAAEQTEQAAQPEEGSSLKEKVEDAVDTVKDKFTGGDKSDDGEKTEDQA